MYLVKHSTSDEDDYAGISKTDLKRFSDIQGNIKSAALSTFINDVFNDKNTFKRFAMAPASVNHHHSETGGLLQHSLEVAESVYIQTMDDLDLQDIAVVAALLHDIGKIKMYTESGYLSKLGKLVNHDDLTLEICANALKALDTAWPDAALTLRHIWTCATPGARYGHSIASVLVHMVQAADRVSRDRYMHNKTLSLNNKKYGSIWTDNTYIWKPKPEALQTRKFKW